MNAEDIMKTITLETNWIIVMVISGLLAAIGGVARALFHHLYKQAFPDHRDAVKFLLKEIQDDKNWLMERSTYGDDTSSWMLYNNDYIIRANLKDKTLFIEKVTKRDDNTGFIRAATPLLPLLTRSEARAVTNASFQLLAKLQDKMLKTAITPPSDS